MLQGAWFNAAGVKVEGVVPSTKPNSTKAYRFLRLVSDCDFLTKV